MYSLKVRKYLDYYDSLYHYLLMLQLRSRSSYLVKEENENVQCLFLRGNSGALLDFLCVIHRLAVSNKL